MSIKKTSLYIEEEVLKELKKLAIEYDKKVNDLILHAIAETYPHRIERREKNV